MSRIGKRPIALHPKINVEIDNKTVIVEGPKGKLQYKLPHQVTLEKKGYMLVFCIENNDKESRALHGLSRTIISNMITGVLEGFCKTLKIQGVGYRAQVDSSQNLILNIGYSHAIRMTAPSGVNIEVSNNTEINIRGISKESVGQFAAQIRSKRPPEPYKGKGIRYNNEIIKKKAGKAGK